MTNSKSTIHKLSVIKSGPSQRNEIVDETNYQQLLSHLWKKNHPEDMKVYLGALK